MKININAYLITDKGIEKKSVEVDKYNYLLVRGSLELQISKIVDILKDLYDKNLIHSIYIPKNKKMQKELDNLVKIKKELKNSVEKIKVSF